jgi:hypothetical protein
MTKVTLFGIRGLCGALAAALFLGLAHPAHTADQPQWVQQLGTSEYDTASGVGTDADGNVYIAGYSGGRFGSDAWVAKYSAAGALRWKRKVATADVVVSDVATDGDGNVYIAGYTRGSLGEPDAWVAKYSATGAVRWERQFGTAESNGASGVASGADSNVYIAGWIGGPQPGETDAWVAKYSAAGALRWKRQFGTSEPDNAYSVATDRDGSVYIAGSTRGSFGGPFQGGYWDAWVAKYSATGASGWKRQLGTSESDVALGVATDEDRTSAAGVTTGSLGGPNQGDGDAWVAKYSARR